jgi:hypothetical protein
MPPAGWCSDNLWFSAGTHRCSEIASLCPLLPNTLSAGHLNALSCHPVVFRPKQTGHHWANVVRQSHTAQCGDVGKGIVVARRVTDSTSEEICFDGARRYSVGGNTRLPSSFAMYSVRISTAPFAAAYAEKPSYSRLHANRRAARFRFSRAPSQAHLCVLGARLGLLPNHFARFSTYRIVDLKASG